MGVYQVCIHHDTPVEVAINEAVELAKLYGGENSAGFVNGVFENYRRAIGSIIVY